MKAIKFSTLIFLLSFSVPAISDNLSIFLQPAPSSGQADIDHTQWSRLLSEYIDQRGGLNYFRYRDVSEEDMETLEDYIENLQSVQVTRLDADEQFAYWINLYNALTVWVILEHYPIESIRDISYGLLTSGPWKEELTTVQGVELSLDDIEHRILRPVFQDSRIHYAVNCASIGCPNLQTTAFTSDNLEDLLEFSAEQYINHPRGARIVDGELIVSSIYDWYEEDFGGNEQSVIEHLLEYASTALGDELDDFDDIDDYEYDWALNE
ncbi:MAG: DUF547 domain-containing protein [Acidiferrobacterales bacterium]|nr:DUF547 domain-containing protein [Acidiferrobacterales bacterium]